MSKVFPKQVLQELSTELSTIYEEQEAISISKMTLESLLGWSATTFIINDEMDLNATLLLKLDEVKSRLLTSEPIQYILGEADFYGRKFLVDQDVLIPRQETESLIQLILEAGKYQGAQIADIGTGSGCIPCTLALETEADKVVAYDISKAALKVAKRNAEILKSEVEFVQLDILKEDLPRQAFDLLISNPPYVLNSEKRDMQDNVLRHEPHLALFVADEDPLLFYRVIAEKGLHALKSKGKLYFEINEQFGVATQKLLENLGYSTVTIHQDLNGKDRFVSAQFLS